MIRHFFLLCVSCFSSSLVYAQEKLFALNQFASQNIFPSSSAKDNDATIALINSRTEIAAGILFQSNIFTSEFPIIAKSGDKRYGGFGVHILQKSTGTSDLLKTLAAGFSAASNLQISKNQNINFGLQAVYNSKRTSLDRLTTGSQWLASEFRFDPTADIGEAIVDNNIKFLAINAGLDWTWREKGEAKMFAGIAGFNLNKPSQSFFGTKDFIPMSWMAHAGAMLYQRAGFDLIARSFAYFNSYGPCLYLQGAGRVHFTHGNLHDIIKSGSMEFVSKTNLSSDLSFGLILNQPRISYGFAYNIGMANADSKRYANNGVEYGLVIRKTLGKKKTPVATNDAKAPADKRTFTLERKSSANQTTSEIDDVQKNINKLDKVTSVRFEMEKDFKFGFGTAELNDDAKAYLGELVRFLEGNPNYKLEIIGHTDNVGGRLVNYRLSEARALVVRNYVHESGIAQSRLKYSGRGDTDPVAPNDSEANRAKNRRVQFIVYLENK